MISILACTVLQLFLTSSVTVNLADIFIFLSVCSVLKLPFAGASKSRRNLLELSLAVGTAGHQRVMRI